MTTQQPIIISATLKEWDACMNGYNRFCELFPDGADLDTAVHGLIKDKNVSWAFWLINKAQKYNFCDVADVFKKISKDDNFVVRMWTAVNLDTPLEALKSLSQDARVEVRMWTARNPNTPTEILKSLSQDADNCVKLCANKTLQKMEK